MRRPERYRGHAVRAVRDGNLEDALHALSVDELRAYIVDALERLDDGPRGELEDALLRRAATGESGWRPTGPPSAIVGEVEAFAADARRLAHAEPAAVDVYLRKAITASLAGDHAVARAIFAALLLPVARADIDLGQHEMVDEVLSADVHDCASRYVAAVYMTTPIANRADAVAAAIEATHGVSWFTDPLEAIGSALGGALPDLEAFLPAWIARLEESVDLASESESDEERWMRAAVGRRDGVAGLERIARATQRPAAVRAWCDAVQAGGDWAKTLDAYETAVRLVTSERGRGTDALPRFPGEGQGGGAFLDGAALAAQVLGREDALEKLEAAWLGAPSLARLLRWLVAGEPAAAAVRTRAAAALKARPTKAPVVIGFLHVLVGDIPAGAQLLESAPGLGWSSDGHPGHLLFPAFAWLLGGTPAGSVREELARGLQRRPREYDFASLDEAGARNTRTPATPSVMDALQKIGVADSLSGQDRRVMLAAMKVAAAKRTDGVLAEKRRRHYGHAAMLVACCVELEGRVRRGGGESPWLAAIGARTSRFPAFREELRRALAQARGVGGPATAR